MRNIAVTFQHLLAALTMTLLLPVKNPPATSSLKTDINTELLVIKKRILDDLTQPAVNTKSVKELISTLQPDGTWPGINYTDVSRTGFEHRIHLENMVELARAYRKNSSPYFKSAEVKKVVSGALDYWLQHDFICDNWWWNEMGTPGHMINILLLMEDGLSEQQQADGLKIARRANLEASGARPGGDLIVIAGMLGKQALFTGNADTLMRVVKVMASEIRVTTGRGLKPDLSFHHRVDNVISTLSYGTNFISSFAYWAVKTSGTQFALPTTSMQLLVDYYLDGICASMVYGKYPDPGAKNRGISRLHALKAAGTELPENLLKATNYRAKELQDIIKIRKGTLKPSLSSEHFFWHSEYFTHQRPGYFTSARMHSSRNHTMEQPHNEEGLLNHHYGDGANFISVTGQEYVDIFPAWDWQKIPGTTVVQKEKLPHWREIAKKGRTDFVGGVTDGLYGAAAFDFESAHDPLKAHKAWFFFDKEYVCLGAGINATANNPVVTTLNQCLLNGPVFAQTGNGQKAIQKGAYELSDVKWVLHNKVAYLFTKPASAQLSNTTATGSRRKITHQAWATDEPVQKDIFCLWLNHGVQPADAGYEYIVLPNADAAKAQRYSEQPAVTILSNTTGLQAVQHKTLSITQMVFYKAGSILLSEGFTLAADKPCMVMVEMSGKSIKKITVADPTHTSENLQITVSSRFESKGSNRRTVWNAATGNTVITIDLPKEGYAGKSVVVSR